jgi:transketolase
MNNYKLNYKIINTLRLLAVDMVDSANSGHPGMPLGCAPSIFVLYCMIMKFNFEEPLWNLRDRFILSNGHGCALLYSILYLMGYNYSKEDLKSFRKLHSKTPGHPEYNKNLGIEISTGPLGQGIANGVGMAISSKKLNIDNTIYVMCGDGCLMEGISYEAASIAGHLKLNNLVILYDDNGITIDGKTDITFTEDVRKRFEALQWNVLEVLDGDNDIQDIFDKLTLAKTSRNKPTIIFIKTTIGYGSVAAGKSSIHGAPLGQKNTELLKEFFEMDKEKSFFVDDDVKEYFDILKQNQRENFKHLLESNNSTKLNDIDSVVQEISLIKNQEKNYATRDSSNIVLRKIVELLPNIIVGSADLAESNKTLTTDPTIFINKDNFQPKYLHYGIREHGMCAIANGISTYDIIPIVSTFLVFITYCLAPIRMAALSKHKVIYVFTHDSVFLGEDGPTHQPIESLTILRSIPNLLVLRPCDTTEVSGAYQIALKNEGPTALIFSRQVLPNIQNSSLDNMQKGAYVVYEPEIEDNKPVELIIIATGSELHLAIEVAKTLDIKCCVVSMPCCELFDQQDANYKEEILPKNIKKMSLEAGSTLGWYKYANYTYGIDTFGESAKINDIKEHFGFTLEKVLEFINEKII